MLRRSPFTRLPDRSKLWCVALHQRLWLLLRFPLWSAFTHHFTSSLVCGGPEIRSCLLEMEWSTEFGHHWFDVATSFSSCSQILSNIFAPSANPYQLAPKLVITLRFFWTDHGNIPLVPVKDIFLNEDEVLKNPVLCGEDSTSWRSSSS